MKNPNFLFIRASAGSGKTYRLSTHYLNLLLAQPELDPGKILATTFTRAAAGEILTRVLKRLAEAVVDGEKRESLRKDILRETLTLEDCSGALERLSGSLHRVSIGTMDSFFSKVARTLPGLLELPHQWSIASDSDAELLSSKVIHQIASNENRVRFSKAWRAFKADACRTRNHEEMLGVLSKIRFLQLASAPALDGRGSLPRLCPQTARQWQEVVQSLPCPMKAASKKGEPQEYSNFRKAIDNLVGLLVEGMPVLALASNKKSQIIRHLLACELVNCPGGGKVEMPSEWATALEKLLKEIRSTARDRHCLRQSGLKELQALFAPARMEASLSAGSLTFDEVMQTVKSGVQWEDAAAQSDLYFHLDCKIDHLLFDEFQDTSLSQYEFFAPLVENIVAGAEEPRSVFVVGDPKQAIYGWRGGDRGLIDSFLEKNPTATSEHLDTSFRSSPVVLGIVDKVFQGMGNISEEEFNPPFPKAAERWLQSYQSHQAKHGDLRGEVTLWCVADKELQQQMIIERVQALIGEKNPSEIAILLRRTQWIPSLIDSLRRLGVDAAPGPSGNFITDSLAVEIILGAIAFIDHPLKYSAAARLASHAPWASALGRAESGGEAGDFWKTARAWTDCWYTHGAGELISTWIRDPDFAAMLSEHDRLRCSQLLALARRFDAAGGGRPDQFLEAARIEKKPGGRPARVRVMTIHASKGLEFESVILGDLSFTQGGGVPLPKFHPDQESEGKLHIVETDEVLAACIERTDGREEIKTTDIMGELSLLYVGMTRARSYLDIVVAKRGPSSRSFSNSSLLQLLLKEEGLVAGENHPLGRYSAPGSKSWAQIAGGNGTKPADPTPDSTVNRVGPSRRDGRSACVAAPFGVRRHDATEPVDSVDSVDSIKPVAPVAPLLERKSPSGQEGGEKVYFKMLHGKSGGQGKKIGTAYHAWLAQIEWKEDCMGATEETVQRILNATQADWEGIERKEAQTLLARVIENIQSPLSANLPLARAFDPAVYAQEWNLPIEQIEVWRERPFSVPIGKELWSGRFDRVIVGKTPQGIPFRFALIDFKSDQIRTAQEKQEKEAFYQGQLAAYEKVLRQMASAGSADPALPSPALEISSFLVFLSHSHLSRGQKAGSR